MTERYRIVSETATLDSKELAAFLSKDGQLLLPMLELVEQAQCAIDDVVDVMGRAMIEAILRMSAEQRAANSAGVTSNSAVRRMRTGGIDRCHQISTIPEL